MASARPINKTLIYKKIQFDDPEQKLGAKTLQVLLKDALDKNPKSLDRSEPINEESDLRRVIGHNKTDRGMLFGQVMLFEHGTDLTFLVENPETSQLEVEIQNISDFQKDEKRREVLQGALYFAVFGDHMAVIQSQSVTFKSLEHHINWLLKDHSGVLDSSVGVILANEPKEAAVKAISAGDFKSVKVGSPLRQPKGYEEAADNDFNETSSVKQRFTDGIDILKAVLREAWSDKLDLPEDVDGENLEVTVEVRYQRQSSAKARKWLDGFARATRHFDPEDTVIKTSKGKTITGNELRLSEKRSILVLNGVIDRADAYSKLYDWIKQLIEEDMIR
jgi:hypothetical protein